MVLATGCVAPADAQVDLDVYRERLEAIREHGLPQTTRIVDRRGRLLAEILPEGYRTWVTLDEIPETLKKAIVATEDATIL